MNKFNLNKKKFIDFFKEAPDNIAFINFRFHLTDLKDILSKEDEFIIKLFLKSKLPNITSHKINLILPVLEKFNLNNFDQIVLDLNNLVKKNKDNILILNNIYVMI
jgi:hypothetical protein